MIRQDYLLRLIEQAAQVFAKLFKLQGDGKPVEFAAAVQQTAEEWLGLTRGELLSLTEEDLIQKLRMRGPLPEFPLRIGIATRLLQLDAEQSRTSGDEAAATAALTSASCLLLRAHILGAGPDLPDFTPALDDLLVPVQKHGLPPRLAVMLLCYYENMGGFATAENVLCDLRDAEGYSDWLEELGNAFYDRLRRHPDDELTLGNLPRSEVEEGSREWKRWAEGQRATQR
ncbi:hypothetical protein GC207_00475 [bacterium]|nr:hypothetical protein [bacterium]